MPAAIISTCFFPATKEKKKREGPWLAWASWRRLKENPPWNHGEKGAGGEGRATRSGEWRSFVLAPRCLIIARLNYCETTDRRGRRFEKDDETPRKTGDGEKERASKAWGGRRGAPERRSQSR